jgi:glycine cleavage system H protein
MDEFHYSDIFATKGIEYLVVILFLIALPLFWFMLNRRSQVTTRVWQTAKLLSAKILRVPRGLYFSGNHTWMFLEKNGALQVGLDDLLLHLTGKVEFSNLHQPGDQILKGGLLSEINQGDKVLRVYSPVSGKVLETNSLLNEDSGFPNEDPYGKGWIYKVKPSHWTEESHVCYVGDSAEKWSENEFQRFKDFLARTMINYTPESAMVVLQDGGELSDHTLSVLPGEIWNDFQKEFLNPNRMKMTKV